MRSDKDFGEDLGKLLSDGNKKQGKALFYILKNDVVVTDLDNNFITILKDGTSNGRVIDALIIKK